MSSNQIIKKLFLFLFSFLLLFSSVKGQASVIVELDESHLSEGYVSTSIKETKTTVAYVIVISKDKVSYNYPVVDGGKYPFTLGNGTYQIMIGEKVEGNKYVATLQKEIKVKIKDETTVYLQSNEAINWENEDSRILKKAQELTKNANTNIDKAKAIHSYITKNYSYDNKKADKVTKDYTPDLISFYKTKKGICYDYVTLTAVMLRSVGVPTKIVKGYESSNPDTYHAWNQVYNETTKQWVTIDTTYDATLQAAGKKIKFEKNEKNYMLDKAY
ncbi:transglutaminase-like domain-containing protein [Lachnoclostridium phytofermentans]|uniref:Transglutaminase domain protein n=1 Tax=Lachnoclostridium phytofermentans (strain ATCC 700394 / DSM 18823 / ISDg) TaxID=357809 RepID=A9KQL7_LACP7|nr:transglutaminase-like domain-containing protein [Lachnoclostridium phytofermentans]ABX41930.1 transglutaminase domain protein [Lachnoclostridium phytofermentans ISDg]